MKNTLLNKTRPAARRAAWGAGAAIAAILAAGSNNALAGYYTPGNLVVLRDGTGSAALSSAGTALFLDQYTTGGAFVSSNAIPATGATALVDSGSATSEGSLTLSPNNQYLVVEGYNTNAGVSGVASTTSLAVPRGLGTVDFFGNYNLAATTTLAFSANNIRCGTTDGNGNFWAVGANSGVNYLGAGPTNPITGTILNNRVIEDIGGNLYYSSGSGSRGVYEIVGTPASGSTVTNTIIGTSNVFGSGSSPYAFVFNPGMTVAYVADSAEYTNSTTQGGIEKWTLAGANWTYAYTLTYGTNGAFGLAANFSGANPVIYATAASGNILFEVTDTGTGGTGNATLLATAGANEAFRGLAFAPLNTVVPPAITSITPAGITTNSGATAAFTVSATGGAPLGYFWYFETAAGTNLIAGATGPALTLPNLLSQNSGNYQVVVSNASFTSVTSSVVSLGVGGLVVLRDGSGSAALSSAGTPIYLDQYTTGGAFVSSNTIPTNGVSALVAGGTATAEGSLTLSPNGQYLVLSGFNTNAGVTGVASTTSLAAPRGLATVDASGNYTLAATTATAFSAADIRSGTMDGNGNFWAVGANSGVNYLGSGTPAAIGGTILNSRVIQDIGGNLFYSSGSGSRGVYEIIGTPASGTTVTNTILATGTLFGTGSSPYAFAFNPGMTVAYVADSNEYTNSTTVGGIEKWTLSGTNWTYAYTLSYGTNGAVGLAVNFSGANPIIYATAGNGTSLFEVTDTGTGGTANASLLATAAANEAFRGLSFAATNIVVPAAPTISGITPANLTTNLGSTVKFTLTANLGNPAATASWYKISGGATNVVAGATGTTLTLGSVSLTNTGSYYAILANASGSATSSIASLTVVAVPTISGISPLNITTNAGQTVNFALSASLGTPAANVFWYETGSPNTLIPGATNTTLTLNNVVGTNSGSYFAILTNASGSATSAVASLTVIDPVIEVEPSSSLGLVGGTVQFGVTIAGTAPVTYQWYFSDTNGNLIAPAVSLGDSSVISGAATSILTITNLQPADLTNFVVVATNVYGAVTSSVASLLSGTNNPGSLPLNSAVLALWDFDGPQFTNTAVNPNSINNPAPFIGYGTASAVGTCFDPGTSPLAGATDPNDVGFDPSQNAYVFTPYGFDQPSPNNSWGTENYPAVTGTNKANGVQFNVSTIGAKNILVSYDSRVSGTASDYERLQYTTNGTTWIDYPASSTFDGLSGSGNAGYYNFSYSLVGFPGVENNPNFGIRVVTEWESTATYGIGTTNFWVGTANSYTSGASGNSAAGTVTYDLVAITGDAITNNNVPAILGSMANTNMVDTNSLTLNFIAIGGTTPPDQLTYSAKVVPQVIANNPLAQAVFTPSFAFGGSGTNRTLTISFAGSPIPDANDAGPILVTATDTNGDSAATWFVLTVGSINQPPTNSLTSLPVTNMLANTVLTIPFVTGSSRDGDSNLSYSVASDNNTVVPNGNIAIGGANGNPTLTITPAANEAGNAQISVTVNDNDPLEPRSTTAIIELMVRPNTNVVLVDYFNYDNSDGALDTVASGLWNHLSGNFGGLKINAGYAAVNTAASTENLQAQLLGSPYPTNSGAVLYASFIVNMSPSALPITNGSYFAVFNDGSGNTANVECHLVAATNGVATPNTYRLGINNLNGATGANSQMVPEDLIPGNNYLVVMSLNVANGFSSLWINPTNNQALPNATDTTPATTNLYGISDFELRESGSSSGDINVGNLTVGLAFPSVFYPAQANPAAFAIAENTTNEFSPLPADGGSDLSLVSVSPDANGTAAISGTNLTFIPAPNFLGTSTVGYTIMDDLGNTSSSTITVTVTNAVIVTPIPLNVQYAAASTGGGSLVVSWANPAFSLQTTTNLLTPWVTVPGATSPYTNLIGTNATQFYRLVH